MYVCSVQETVPLPEPVADVDEAEHVVGHTLAADAFGQLSACKAHFTFFKDVAVWQICAIGRPFLAAQRALARKTDLAWLAMQMIQNPV
jgi:hypothetical protein